MIWGGGGNQKKTTTKATRSVPEGVSIISMSWCCATVPCLCVCMCVCECVLLVVVVGKGRNEGIRAGVGLKRRL
jgi:hypothetical protein